ncbi:MAG TPA: PTS glucose transporter subunit IIA [Pseudonocardia sp.]|nr:PTS glucose transporter subunit IIA [Pseudonocardia sp.]
MTRVSSPVAGTLTALVDVPDPVFAGQLVGSGAAVEPLTGAGPLDVLAPVSGQLVKVHPHAFIVVTPGGTGVLVHLGIDTVKLEGAGFTLHAAEGDRVDAGTRIVTFDPDQVRAGGLSASCPVVVLDSAADSIDGLAYGSEIRPGDPLFDWPDGPAE